MRSVGARDVAHVRMPVCSPCPHASISWVSGCLYFLDVWTCPPLWKPHEEKEEWWDISSGAGYSGESEWMSQIAFLKEI